MCINFNWSIVSIVKYSIRSHNSSDGSCSFCSSSGGGGIILLLASTMCYRSGILQVHAYGMNIMHDATRICYLLASLFHVIYYFLFKSVMLPFIGLLFACDRVNYGHGSARTGQESPQDLWDTAAEARRRGGRS